MILKLLVLIILIFILPELIGLLFLKFWKNEEKNILFAFPIGYAIEFGIAQLLTVPMIFCEVEYKVLFWSFYIILFILAILSIILNLKNIKSIFISAIKKIKETPKFVTIIILITIALQCYMYAGKYTYINDDDAYYVGTATTTIETNTLFKYSPTTGELTGEQLLLRYRLGPFPVFYALIASAVNMPPATIAHIILPIAFIIAIYCIYFVLGYEVFDKNIEKTNLFVLILSVLNLFGNYSDKTSFSLFLLRIWQGKALLSNFILPLILLLMLKAENCEYKFISLLLITITVIAGVFTTTMGIALPVIVIGILGFIFGIKDKNIKNMFKCFLCCIPALIYGAIYFLS